MAKSQPQSSSSALPAPHLPDLGAFGDVMKRYGVTETYVPEAPTVRKMNLDELCVLTTPLMDNQGELIKKVRGHSGPMMFLRKKGEQDGDKFENYDGFYIYAFLHPKFGELAVTIGRLKGEDQPVIVEYIESLNKGAWFQVASIETGASKRTFQPVPVQTLER